MHRITSYHPYGLKVVMGDYDGQFYHAVFGNIKVKLILEWQTTIQVGGGPEYILTVGDFRHNESNLGDSMAEHNGMKFTTK